MLTIQQTSELLNIIDRNQSMVMLRELGPEFLTDSDKELLIKNGVDVSGVYKSYNDTIFTSFHLGLLAESLMAAQVKKLTYDQLKEYIKHGDYIPLTIAERTAINHIKAQKLNDLKTFKGRIFQDVNQILINNSLKEQREFIKNELIEGILNKKSVSQISNLIAEKTGDWSRDFDRIVAYNSQTAFEQGKAAMIKRNAGEGIDPKVYKWVYYDACDHCIRLYLTEGPGSQPKLFSLSELEANGNNIGRKVKDWKPVIPATHPFCRCQLRYLPSGYIWNQKTQRFEAPTKETYKPNRPLIRVWINGHEAHV